MSRRAGALGAPSNPMAGWAPGAAARTMRRNGAAIRGDGAVGGCLRRSDHRPFIGAASIRRREGAGRAAAAGRGRRPLRTAGSAPCAWWSPGSARSPRWAARPGRRAGSRGLQDRWCPLRGGDRAPRPEAMGPASTGGPTGADHIPEAGRPRCRVERKDAFKRGARDVVRIGLHRRAVAALTTRRLEAGTMARAVAVLTLNGSNMFEPPARHAPRPSAPGRGRLSRRAEIPSKALQGSHWTRKPQKTAPLQERARRRSRHRPPRLELIRLLTAERSTHARVPGLRPPVTASSHLGTVSSLVAYSSNVSGSYEPWAVPVRGGEPRRGAGLPGCAVRQVTWTPDGKEPVFSADRGGDERYRLYRVPVEEDGGEPVEISSVGDCRRVPAAAPFDAAGRCWYMRPTIVIRTSKPFAAEFAGRRGAAFHPPAGCGVRTGGVSPDGRCCWRRVSFPYRYRLLPDRFDRSCGQAGVRDRWAGVFDPCAWAPDSAGFYLPTDSWGSSPLRPSAPWPAAPWPRLTGRGGMLGFLPWAGDAGVVGQPGRTLHPARPPQRHAGGFARASLGGRYRVWSGLRRGTRGGVDRCGHPPGGDRRPRPCLIPFLLSHWHPPSGSAGHRAGRAGDDHLSGRRRAPHPRPALPSPRKKARIGAAVHSRRPRGSGAPPLPVRVSTSISSLKALPSSPPTSPVPPAMAPPIKSSSTGTGAASICTTSTTPSATCTPCLGQMPTASPWPGPPTAGSPPSPARPAPYPWAAGVPICGPATLFTLAQAAPSTWKTFVTTVLGAPDTDADKFLERSPVTHADHITAPCMSSKAPATPRSPNRNRPPHPTPTRPGRGCPLRHLSRQRLRLHQPRQWNQSL